MRFQWIPKSIRLNKEYIAQIHCIYANLHIIGSWY